MGSNANNQSPVIFVAGATGYTGQAVVRLLAEKWQNPIAHVRPDSPRATWWKNHFTSQGAPVDFTEWELSAMTKRLTELKPTHILFLIGTTKARIREAGSGRKKREQANYEAVDFGLVTLLVQAALKAGIKPHFLYVSSMGVGPRAWGAYLKTKWKAEESVRQSGLPYTIVRPPLISGNREEKRMLEEQSARIFKRLSWVTEAVGLKRMAKRLRPITGDELAKALIGLLFDEKSLNRTLEPEELSS